MVNIVRTPNATSIEDIINFNWQADKIDYGVGNKKKIQIDYNKINQLISLK